MHAHRVSVLSEFLHCWVDHKLQHRLKQALPALGEDKKNKLPITPNYYHYGNESTAAASWKILLLSSCLVQTESVGYYKHAVMREDGN